MLPGQANLPAGFRAVPIQESLEGSPLRVCVLTRSAVEPVEGHLVLLRATADALVYLGCVTDAGGMVREWMEVWVQSPDQLNASFASARESLSNQMLDDRWKQETELLAALERSRFLQTGWEAKHSPPIFLDLKSGGAVSPEGAWEFCEDEKALTEAGLPAYGRSLARYFRRTGAEEPFVGVGENAVLNDKAVAAKEAWANTHVPFNTAGGFVRVLSFCPFGLDDYSDLLSSEKPPSIVTDKRKVVLNSLGITDSEALQQSGSLLFGASKIREAKLPEVFYLKIQLLLDVLRKVRAFVERQQLPFLNLSAESFRVRLAPVGSGLPAFWTAEAGLVKTGNARALSLSAGGTRYFVRTRADGENIYLPEGISRFFEGAGVVRIRKVRKEKTGTVVEGTLVPEQPRKFSPNDLFWLRLPLRGERIDLYGNIYAAESLAAGEVRFATLPQDFSIEMIQRLESAEGTPFPSLPFQVVPILSSPCDLYSMGVLAVRCLLVNAQNSLAVALDEVFSLARETANKSGTSATLPARVGEVMRRDTRFLNALGPHRLLREPMEPKVAFQTIPEELWHEMLATVIRCFPGATPESYCKDFGDAPSLALETVFTPAITDFERTLLRTRSLIFIDWNANREMHSVIRGFKKG